MSATPDKPGIDRTASVTAVINQLTSPSKNGSQETIKDPNKLTSAAKLKWNEQTESLLADWGDIASCYSWLHDQSFRKYNRINHSMTIPVAILNVVAGALNLSMQSLVPPQYVNMSLQAVGGLNIITGIITSIQSIFRYAQLAENHHNAEVDWSKLERNIRIELRIERKNRKEADGFIKVVRAEYDRLMVSSPTIPDEILEKGKKHFLNFDGIITPDICGDMKHTHVTRPEPTPPSTPMRPPSPPQPPSDDKTSELLQDIKDMLAESRLVSVGMKDNEIPHAYKFAPRKADGYTSYGRVTIDHGRRGRSESDTTTVLPSSTTGAPASDIELDIKPRKNFLGSRPSLLHYPSTLITTSTPSGSNVSFEDTNGRPIVLPKVNDLKKFFEQDGRQLGGGRATIVRALPPVTPRDSSTSRSDIVIDIKNPLADPAFDVVQSTTGSTGSSGYVGSSQVVEIQLEPLSSSPSPSLSMNDNGQAENDEHPLIPILDFGASSKAST